MQNHQLTAASVPLTIGGETFQASPLGDKDHSELDLWAQAKIIKIARAASEDLDPIESREILNAAFDKAFGTSWMMSTNAFGTFEGAARVAWQMIKKNHSDVTLERVKELVTQTSDLLAVNDAITLLHNPENKDENGEAAKN